jgi:hypothetical protein
MKSRKSFAVHFSELIKGAWYFQSLFLACSIDVQSARASKDTDK